ncbi:MAG: hypothetical protein EBT13_17240, partial [Rhodobacteraceae bacterium]|nr:hypothetical protein [Paracoccaceae bacterium]
MQIEKILDDHAKWLRNLGGEKAELSGAGLRDADLSGADLSEADLSGADLSLADLRRLDAGAGAMIPTLREVLDLIAQRCKVNVELKGEQTAAPVCALLEEYCGRGWNTEDFLISSFSHGLLAECDARYRRGALFGKLLPDQWLRAERLDAWSVNFDQRYITAELVSEAHSRGYKVLTYTANSPAD